jgi:hypothetical protein
MSAMTENDQILQHSEEKLIEKSINLVRRVIMKFLLFLFNNWIALIGIIECNGTIIIKSLGNCIKLG